MPLPNRVDPFGTLFATTDRGMLMGNRGGRFHDIETREAKPKHWVSRQWICCEISFRGRKRDVWGKSYTELFFSDEAAALASGHRPCFECRRVDAVAFAEAWGRATGAPPPRAAVMDSILHEQRLLAGSKRLHVMDWEALPNGAMIVIQHAPFALWNDMMRPWSFVGYGPVIPRPTTGFAHVITPPAIVACLAHGYQPR
jgi:hypothetical protein